MPSASNLVSNTLANFSPSLRAYEMNTPLRAWVDLEPVALGKEVPSKEVKKTDAVSYKRAVNRSKTKYIIFIP